MSILDETRCPRAFPEVPWRVRGGPDKRSPLTQASDKLIRRKYMSICNLGLAPHEELNLKFLFHVAPESPMPRKGLRTSNSSGMTRPHPTPGRIPKPLTTSSQSKTIKPPRKQN